MPIPIDTLRKQQRPHADRLMEFLQAHSDQAYTLVELVAELEGYEDTNKLGLAMSMLKPEDVDQIGLPYFLALKQLVKDGSVSFALHQGREYYAAIVKQ